MRFMFADGSGGIPSLCLYKSAEIVESPRNLSKKSRAGVKKSQLGCFILLVGKQGVVPDSAQL